MHILICHLIYPNKKHSYNIYIYIYIYILHICKITIEPNWNLTSFVENRISELSLT